MILPATTPKSENRSAARVFADALREEAFTGEISTEVSSRLLAATDNSIYQIMPALVVFPRDGDDLDRLAAVAARPEHHTIRFSPRGGGTGTNGQSLTEHVVIDTSRHTNRILSIQLECLRATVEPGVVLAQLNSALEDADLFFPPSTSTATRVTIGGMVGTDACGKGSRVYGRTGDYIESLELLLPDGRQITCRRYSAEELDTSPDNASLALAREVRNILQGAETGIRTQFPKLSRSLTGYNLWEALGHDGSIDLARLVTGAEGTLGLVRSITVRLEHRPQHKAVVVIRYHDFDEALRDAQWLLESDPTAIETLDHRLYGLAKRDEGWHLVADAMQADDADDHAVTTNFVEISASTSGELETRLQELAERLRERGSSHSITRDLAQMAELWNIRSRSVGMLGRTSDARKPIPFVEDTVVPPEHLADYIREFRALLDDHGVDYAMFGHVDVGCLHVRPALDMASPDDARLVRSISDEVVALVKRYRGLLWGEHGKGFRGEYTREFFGESLYPVLGRIKAAFDPNNRMNPGKIVDPIAGAQGVTAIDQAPLRGQRDARIGGTTRLAWNDAIACNGNGVCFDWSFANTICPSYKVTRDRVHSPKGRATLLREWLKQLADNDLTPSAIPSRRPRRRRASHREDFSHEVFDAMSGCLGCKACATQCPVHVDIPEMRSRFLQAYHRVYRRPLRDYALAGTEFAAAWLGRAPALGRVMLRNRGVQRCLKAFGISDAPAPASPGGLVVAKQHGYLIARSWQQAKARLASSGNCVALLPDAFTAYYENETLPAVCRLVEANGYEPVVLPYQPSGKALHVHGFMDGFRGTAGKLVSALESVLETHRPVVAIEASVGLFLRDECRGVTTGKRPLPIWLLPEWLAQHGAASAPTTTVPSDSPYHLFLHCTEKTAVPAVGNLWAEAFQQAGLAMQTVNSGCCGMAGAYGHQSEHYERSHALYNASWAPTVNEQHPDRILATGFSCRSQTERFGGIRPRHPAVALADAFKENAGHAPAANKRNARDHAASG